MNKKRIDKLFYKFNHSKKPLDPKIFDSPDIKKHLDKVELEAMKPL